MTMSLGREVIFLGCSILSCCRHHERVHQGIAACLLSSVARTGTPSRKGSPCPQGVEQQLHIANCGASSDINCTFLFSPLVSMKSSSSLLCSAWSPLLIFFLRAERWETEFATWSNSRPKLPVHHSQLGLLQCNSKPIAKFHNFSAINPDRV